MKTSLLAIYLGLLYWLSGFQGVITPDGYYYCAWVATSNFPAIYPALIQTVHLATDLQTAGTIVSMLAVCGSVVLVYLITKRYTKDYWAIITAVVFALAPITLRSGVLVMSEATYVLFILLAVYYFEHNDWLCGLFSGLAFATRPEGAVVFGALSLFYLIRHKKIPWGMGLFVVVVLLNSTVIWVLGGKFALTMKTVSNVGGGMADMSTYRFDYFVNLAREAWGAVGFFGIPLIGLFVFSVCKRPTYLLLGCAMFLVFPLMSGYGIYWRFLYPYLPFVIMSVMIWSSKAERVIRTVMVLCILAGYYDTKSLATMPDEPFTELKEAGLFLKPYVNDSTLIMGKKSYTAFYAGLPTKQFIHTPNVSIDSLYRYAKKNNVTYLVLSRRATQMFHPRLMGVFDDRRFKRVTSNNEVSILTL